MSERKVKAEVEIFGDSYILKGNAPPEYLEMLAEYVNQKMEYIHEKCPGLTVSKIAILTAINIADELMKMKREYRNLVRQQETCAGNGGKAKKKQQNSPKTGDEKDNVKNMPLVRRV